MATGDPAGNPVYVRLWECPTSAYIDGACTQVADSGASPGYALTGTEVVDLDFDTPYLLDNTKYYALKLVTGHSQTGGTFPDDYWFSAAYGTNTGSQNCSISNLEDAATGSSPCAGLKEPYYILYGLGGPGVPEVNNNTRFISFDPTLGTTTATSTSAAFRIGATGFVNADDYATSTTKLHIRFMQQTGAGVRGNSVLLTRGDLLLPITSSGFFNLSTTTSILATGVYQAYFAIEKPRFSVFGFAFLTTTLRSAIGTFIVGTTTTQIEIDSVRILTETTGGGLVDTVVPTEETASSTVLGLGAAFGLTSVILDKFPINWVIEYANVLSSLASSTATTTIPTVSVDYSSLHMIQSIPTTTAQSLSFTFFSGVTLDQVGALPGIQAGRTLVSYMLWIGLMFYVWRRVSGLFSSAQ